LRWRIAVPALVVLAASAFGLAFVASRGDAGRHSPIILISVDTLRADRLPAYGYEKITTPAIDELAKNGTLFENCYSQVPLTLPSHTSLFTGLLPSEHGVRDNVGFKVPPGATTLAGELRQIGYSTGGAVSAYVLHSSTGISQGFDWYDDEFKPAGPDTPLTDVRRDGNETLERALAWLEEQSKAAHQPSASDRPIFLFVHFYEPHAPYTAPARFQQKDRVPYDAAVMYSDEIVGKLFAGLRRLGLYDPSLIIFLSDHGEGLREHGEETHGVLLYREDMHVPLIIKLPGSTNGGRRVEAPVQLVDIAPTVREWVGLPADPRLQGASLLPALEGRTFAGDRSIIGESLYGRLHFGWKELFSLTNSTYNYILAPREELYDIRTDAGEVHNLLTPGGHAASLPAAVAREYQSMRDELTSYVAKTGMPEPKAASREELEKLRNLGYLGGEAGGSGAATELPDPKDRIGDLGLYQQAMRMKSVFMFAKVANALQKVLETSPRMIDAWDQLSEVDQRLGRLDGAVDALKHSLAIAPQRTAQRLALADLLIELKRFDEAREQLGIATPYDPDDALVRVAFLDTAEGKPEAAREAAGRAARGVPSAVPFIDGVLSYGKGEYAHALPLFQQALSGVRGRSPDTLPYIHFYLGDTLAREARAAADPATRARLLREAEGNLRTELDLRPSNAAAATSLCFVHALSRQLQKVDQDLNDFARQNPSIRTYRLIADLYANMKLNDRAARWREKARMAETHPGLIQ
jgi:arylsulfatase A-like enzyme